MNPIQVESISYNENNINGKPNPKTVLSELLKFLPNDLLTEITVLLQDSGYVTIRPLKLTRIDWIRLDRSVKNMGGTWVSNARFSHWSIPLIRFN